jgi:hypothetical protein
VLVTEHQNLQVLGSIAAGEQDEQLGGNQQIHLSSEIGQQLGQVAGVTNSNLGQSGPVGREGVVEVGPGQVRPAAQAPGSPGSTLVSGLLL